MCALLQKAAGILLACSSKLVSSLALVKRIPLQPPLNAYVLLLVLYSYENILTDVGMIEL